MNALKERWAQENLRIRNQHLTTLLTDAQATIERQAQEISVLKSSVAMTARANLDIAAGDSDADDPQKQLPEEVDYRMLQESNQHLLNMIDSRDILIDRLTSTIKKLENDLRIARAAPSTTHTAELERSTLHGGDPSNMSPEEGQIISFDYGQSPAVSPGTGRFSGLFKSASRQFIVEEASLLSAKRVDGHQWLNVDRQPPPASPSLGRTSYQYT